MGFFDFLRKGENEKAAEAPRPVKMQIHEVPSWIDGQFSDRIADINAGAKLRCENLASAFSKIKDSVRELEKAKLENDEKKLAPVKMVKSLFVKRSYSLIGSIPTVPERLGFSELEGFRSASSKLLNSLKKVSPKQAILISNFFKKEAGAVFEGIKEAETGLESLDSFMKNEAVIKKTVQDVRTIVSEEARVERQLNFLVKKEEEAGLKLKSTKKAKKDRMAELDSLLESNEWKAMESMKKETEELRERASRLKSQIVQELSAVNRPLKKLEHATGPISGEDAAFLNDFLKSPFDSFIKNSNESMLKKNIELLNRMVSSRSIMLKQKDHEKLLDFTRKLESKMPAMKENYAKFKAQISKKTGEMEREFPGLLVKKRTLESEIGAAEKEESRLTSELSELGKSRESIKKEIEASKKRLAELVKSGTGIPVVLS